MFQSSFIDHPHFYLLILTLAYVSTYITGRLISLAIKEINSGSSQLAKCFSYLTTGFISLVTIIALIYTRGDSVFLLSLIIILFYIFYRKKTHKDINSSFSKKEFWIFILGYIVLISSFTVSYYSFFIRGGGNLFEDFMFYANVSKVLSVSHIESISLFIDKVSPAMYHYGELWFNAFWADLFKVNHLHTLILVTNTYLLTLIIIGSIALIHHYFGKKSLFILLLSILFLVFNPLSSFFVSYQLPILTHPKFFVIAIFVIFAVLRFIQLDKFMSFNILLLLIPFNSLLVSGILSGLFFFSIYYHIRKDGYTIKSFFNKYTISTVFILLFLGAFYGLRALHSENITDLQPIRAQPISYGIEAIGRSVIYTVVRVIPALLLFWLLSKQKKYAYQMYTDMIIAATIGGLFSAVTGGLFSIYNIDGLQLSTNYNGVLLGIVIFCCLLYLLSIIKSSFAFIISSVLLICNIWTFPSDIYLKSNTNKDEIGFYNKLNVLFDKEKPLNFGYIRNYKIEQNINSPYTRIRMIMPLKKMAHILPDGYYAPYCLSALEIPDSTFPKFNEKKDSYLWKYVEKLKSEGIFVDKETAIINFIENKEINYIIVEKQAELPVFITQAKIVAEFDGNKVYFIDDKK